MIAKKDAALAAALKGLSWLDGQPPPTRAGRLKKRSPKHRPLIDDCELGLNPPKPRFTHFRDFKNGDGSYRDYVSANAALAHHANAICDPRVVRSHVRDYGDAPEGTRASFSEIIADWRATTYGLTSGIIADWRATTKKPKP